MKFTKQQVVLKYLLNDNFQCLAKGHRLIIEDIEVQLVTKVRRSFQ